MLIDIAREEKGYKIALLQPSPKAVPLYERVGFKKVESYKGKKGVC
jgi:predicted acetyltransferase